MKHLKEVARGFAKKTLRKWAGGTRRTLAILFTDIVDSTAIANELGDQKWTEVRDRHFFQARKLIRKYEGYEVKTIGDSFMIAFYTAVDALYFAFDLQDNTGDPLIKIRAGVHVGEVSVEENDLTGSEVNFASRVNSHTKRDWIMLSDRAKADIDKALGCSYVHITYDLDSFKPKGFGGTHYIWHVFKTGLKFPSSRVWQVSKARKKEGDRK